MPFRRELIIPSRAARRGTSQASGGIACVVPSILRRIGLIGMVAIAFARQHSPVGLRNRWRRYAAAAFRVTRDEVCRRRKKHDSKMACG